MIKRIFTKWQVWACLCAVFVIIAALQIHYNNNPVSVERRAYMTDEEFQHVNVGMSQDEFLKVQDAKPALDAVPIDNNKFVAHYDGKDKKTDYTFYFETRPDGKNYIHMKQSTYTK